MECEAAEEPRAIDLCRCDEKLDVDELDWSVRADEWTVEYYWSLGGMALAVAVLNLAVVVGVARDSSLHQLHNWLIVGQALCDLFVGTLVSVFCFGTIANDYELIGKQIGCDVYGFGIVISCLCTVMSLALIAHSRRARIVNNDHSMTKKRCLKYYILGVWVFPSSLLLYYSNVTEARLVCSGSYCNPVWNTPVILMCGPTMAIPVLYVFWAYRAVEQRVNQSLEFVRKSASFTFNDQYRHNRMTALMRLMSKSVLAMWIPLYLYFVLLLVNSVSGVLDPHSSSIWFFFERMLGYSAVASSMVSPVLYGYKNKALKLAMMYAFLPKSWKKRARARWQDRTDIKFARRASYDPQDCPEEEKNCLYRCLWAPTSDAAAVADPHAARRSPYDVEETVESEYDPQQKTIEQI